MIALIILLTLVLALLVVAIVLPFIREAVADRHVRQVRDQQQLTEARLRVLNQFTLQRMHGAVRQQRDSDE